MRVNFEPRLAEERNVTVREIIDFLKDIFLLKKEENVVGLNSFKRKRKPVEKSVSPKKNKEPKLSDLMRRA